MGGSGKTQICLKFTEQALEGSDKRFSQVFWVDATTDNTIKQSFKAIKDDQQVESAGFGDTPDAILRWLATLTETDPWLLIIDNADYRPDKIEEYLPYGPGANAVITSRNPAMKTLSAAYAEVDVLQEEEALILLTRSARLDLNIEALLDTAKEVVSELHCLHLHLTRLVPTLEHSNDLLDDPRLKGASKYNRAVYATWDQQQPRAALRLLMLFTFFHHGNIMEEIFQRAAIAADNDDLSCHPDDPENKLNRTFHHLPRHFLQLNTSLKWDPYQFREGVGALISLSLVKRSLSGKTYDMHPLVHAWSRQRIYEKSFKIHARSTIATLGPHNDTTLSATLTLADTYFRQGKLSASVTLLEEASAERHRVWGENHPKALNSMFELGVLYSRQKRFTEAEANLLKGWEVQKRLLREDHPDTLTPRSWLARAIYGQGRLKEAKALYERVLQIQREVFGEDDLNTLFVRANLAHIAVEEANLTQARELYESILQAGRKAHGDDHPDTLCHMVDLSWIIWRQGEHAEAKEMLEEALNGSRKTLGDDHPDTLSTMRKLGELVRTQGDLAAAQALLEEALEKQRRVLEEDHQDITLSMYCLA
ncbi:hypothetical protein MMC30_002971 [Trapelia coarctata]|nr:hypothetical protein [Trapelia coarctata]